MPIFDYKCDKCGNVEEHISFKVPENCPKCLTGKFEQQFSPTRISFDIIGSCYMNDYGKHAWKRNMSVADQASVLTGEKNPY
jgi:putative FmdB family regulatory protein